MPVTATEFAQDISRYQEAAQLAPVIVTQDGRPQTVLISATLFKLLTNGRVARPVEDLDAATRQAIIAAQVPSYPKP